MRYLENMSISQVCEIFENMRKEGVRPSLRLLSNHLFSNQNLVLRTTSCNIGLVLPKSTQLPHPTGIVIHGDTNIEENVRIHQNVTLGLKHGDTPVIEDGVVIYAGAVIVGDTTVGENSVISANSVVLDDVPPNTTPVGTPAEIVE